MLDLTVIIPIYNVKNYLKKCVLSILTQEELPQKIILIDDGSTDGSGQLADKLKSKSDLITVIHKENGGLSSARNYGIELSTTKYITFVDSDDYVEKSMYKELTTLIENNDADISIGGVWYTYENGDKYSPYKPGVNKIWTKKEALKELNSYKYFNMGFWNKIFKRELFEQSGYGDEKLRFPEGKISEDLYLMHKVIARAEKIAYTSKPLYFYVQRTGSISRGKKINLEALKAAKSQVDFYQKWFPDISYIAESAYLFTYMWAYSAHIKRNLKCPADILEESKVVSRKYIKSILKNDVIPKKKKLQALVFRYLFPAYKHLVRRKFGL